MINSTRLLDAFDVDRPRPENLMPADDALFAHEYRRSFGPTDLYELENVRVTGDGVVIRGARVLDELTLAPQFVGAGRRYVLASLRRRRRRFDRPDERYLAVFNQWSDNYFHWMCDVLPRIYLVRSLARDGTLVLPAGHDAPYVEQSLAPFGLRRIERFAADEIAWFERVTIPGHIAVSGNYHEPTIRGLAGFLRRALAEPAPADPDLLVYATRRGAGYRHVRNEDEVVQMLSGLGFRIVVNEELSFAEQVSIYSRARLVVGTMGANLTNAMFMPEGAVLLQLSRAGDDANNLYWALASAVGARFRYQLCAYEDTRPGNFWNLDVDVDALRRNVVNALGAG
jgi:capsular polysaccharide biosynthesis protein